MEAVNDGATTSQRPPAPAPIPNAKVPPPFLVKTYDMVDDHSTDEIVSWSSTNNSFVVWDPPEFARDLLPKYFKHNNFSMFVGQLNTYGFRKVDPAYQEFANEGFLRGQRHLLRSISQRKPVNGHNNQRSQRSPGQSSSVGPVVVEVGEFGLEEEVEMLKRDKNVLMLELVRLRQQQQASNIQVQAMLPLLQGMEQMTEGISDDHFVGPGDFQNVEKMVFVPILPGHELFQDKGVPQDSFDQQHAINNRSEIVSVERSNINVTHSQEKITRTIPQSESKKGGVKIAITLEEILQTSKMSLAGAAKKLEVSRSTLKRACRSHGYERWPPRKSQFSVDKESIPPLNNDMPSNHAQISIVNGKPQDQTAMQDVNVVTMKAKYGNDMTIKFQLTLSSTLVDLEQHVAKRLKLEAGTYYIKYRDPMDGDLILIACDEDLQEYLSTSGLLDSTFLVFLEPK